MRSAALTVAVVVVALLASYSFHSVSQDNGSHASLSMSPLDLPSGNLPSASYDAF